MMYSELIEMAIYELNQTKKGFAEEIGIAVTTLYRILDNKVILPNPLILEKLSKKGIDITVLNYNDIYFEYVSRHFNGAYEWVSDIDAKEEIILRHKKCKTEFSISVYDLEHYRCLCPLCSKRQDTDFFSWGKSNIY